MSGGWKTEKSETISQNNFFALKRDTILLPNNRHLMWHYLDGNDFVIVPGLTNDNKIIAIRQFRYLLARHCIEFAAGGIHNNEKPEDAAMREFEEETGYKARKLVHLGSFYESVVKSRNKGHIFLATDISKGIQSLDNSDLEYEEIEPVFITTTELRDMITKNTFESGIGALTARLLAEYIEKK